MKKWQYYLTLLVLLLSSVLSPVSAWAQEVAAPQETSALVGDSQAQPEAEATEESEEGLDPDLPSDVDLDELIRQAPNVKAVPNVVTRIYATTRDGKPITKNLLKWEAFRINVDFTLPNNVIKAGDTTVIEVPSTLAFTEVSNFEVRDSSGQHVVATATIQPGARTVTLTYTSYAQNNSDITGNLFFYARINHAEVTEKGNVDLNFVVENKPIPGGSVPFEGAPIPKGNPMDKSGWQLPGQPNKIRYIVAVNRRGEQRKHVVIRDYLKDEGLAIDQSSVSITKGHWVYQNGGWVLQNAANAAGSYNVTWDQGNTGFTIDFGDLDTQTGFEILYTVNIPYDAADGEKFGNYAAMNDANGTVAYTNYDYSYSIAGGNAEGYTFVVKVHKHDGQGKDLAGAEFEVVRDANKKVVGKIVTDAQGNGQVAGLLRDAYTLREIKAPDGYQLSNEEIKIQGGDFGADKSVLKQVVNVPAVTTVDVRGTKTWSDAENQDGLRPEQITVKLLADGVETGQTTTATAANNWTYEFTNLPKNKAGKAITYSVAEEAVAGYNTKVNGYNLTNSHTPEAVSVQGTKTWEDGDNQDGLRPGQVTIKLLADGVETGQTAVASAANNWTYEFSNLPKNKAGKAITYSVAEEAVAGYTASVNGYNLTNSHTPETVSVQGTKTWQDNDNQDGVRPEQVTIKLLADGVETGQTAVAKAANNWTYEFSNLPKNKAGKAIAYSVQEEAVAEYTASYQAYNVTNSHTPGQTSHTVQKVWDDGQNQDGVRPVELKVQLYADDQKYGDEISLTAANNWTYTWSQLPEKAQGKAISYQAREVAVPEGYQADQPTTQATVTTLTNRHTPEVTSVSGTKTWKDNNNQDGVRPERIKVNLLADGVLKASKEVSAADNWSYSFDNLPKFAAGQAVVYTITEDAVAEYSTQVEGYNLTNSHTPGQTSLTVTKQWQDQGDQDGLRPSQIQVQLYADGVASGSPVTLTAANNWVYTWSGLAEKANGKTIEYSVKEVDQPSGYTSTTSQVSPGNVLIVNQHTPATTEVKGQKTWDDANNQDGKRPESVTVQLYADGQVVASQVVTAANNWTYSFSNLPQFAKGKAISYSVQELVDAGLDKAGYRPSYDGYNIANHYKPEVTTFEVRKVWNDQNDQDKLRPSQIQVQLYANGKAFGEPVTLKADNDWRHVFADLAKYQEGKEVVYTVEEVDVPSGYSGTSSQTGVNQVTLTNTHQPKRPEDPGKKDLPKTGSAETFSLALAGLMAMTGLGILWGTKRRQA